MYAQRYTEVLSCNHWCSEKAISITYCGYVFVALGIQLVMRMGHIICDLSGSAVFFRIISQKARFSKKSNW